MRIPLDKTHLPVQSTISRSPLMGFGIAQGQPDATEVIVENVKPLSYAEQRGPEGVLVEFLLFVFTAKTALARAADPPPEPPAHKPLDHATASCAPAFLRCSGDDINSRPVTRELFELNLRHRAIRALLKFD